MAERKIVLTDEELEDLTSRQKKYYKEAEEAFKRNMSYLIFEERFLSLDKTCPLYEGMSLRTQALQMPLYKVIEEMWLELAVNQGVMKRS